MKAEHGTAIKARQRDLALAVITSAADAAMRLRHERDNGCLTGCTLPAYPASRSRLFRATADQVRPAREFVKAQLAGHPAVDDAVFVASELAANSVAHSVSGRDGGLFLVRIAEISATHDAVLVTERRGHGRSVALDAGPDAESGRGLAVVESLTCLFSVSEAGSVRTLLAIVPAEGPR